MTSLLTITFVIYHVKTFYFIANYEINRQLWMYAEKQIEGQILGSDM